MVAQAEVEVADLTQWVRVHIPHQQQYVDLSRGVVVVVVVISQLMSAVVREGRV